VLLDSADPDAKQQLFGTIYTPNSPIPDILSALPLSDFFMGDVLRSHFVVPTGRTRAITGSVVASDGHISV